jgi:hypothetical protein
MLTRRLLILAAVLLGLGALAASLAPRDLRGPGRPTTITTVVRPPALPAPAGRDLALSLDADAARPGTVLARVGDHVRLTVRAAAPDAVSIPALGQVQPVDPYSPAQFDFVADRPLASPITLQQTGRRVGTLRIAAASRLP